MLSKAANEIVRYSDIKDAVGTVGKYVNITPDRPMIACVDGRDKPGHDAEFVWFFRITWPSLD
jgi:hypothetical protein